MHTESVVVDMATEQQQECATTNGGTTDCNDQRLDDDARLRQDLTQVRSIVCF